MTADASVSNDQEPITAPSTEDQHSTTPVGPESVTTKETVETPPRKDEPKAKPCMEGLSEELKAMIIDWVLRPSDLKNVCLVNKQFHSIAVRPLYRHVAFDLGGANDHRLSSFLSPTNIGLKYIRRLRLYLAPMINGDNCSYRDHVVKFATRMILEFLPEDVLEEFNWCPWKAFGTDNLLLLYRRQRKLKVLEAMRLDRDVLPELKKKDADLSKTVFKSARELGLYPEDRTTLNMGGYLIEKTRDLIEELIINWANPSSNSDGDPITDRDLNDSPTGPGLLTSSIFSHMMPFDKCTPFPRLKSLSLYNVSVRNCVDTWCKVIDFQNLDCVRLGNCGGADALIGQLSKPAHMPKKLKTLSLENRGSSDELLVALDGFLCLVSGIKDMYIEMIGVSTLPAAAGIARHAKTLTMLSVHCSPLTSGTSNDSDRSVLVYETADFERICKACTKLQQLSCAWPATSLMRSPNDKWKAYESATHHLRDLVTLHVASYPTNKPSKRLLQRSIYQKLIHSLAQRMFELAVASSPTPSEASSTDSTTTPTAANQNNGDEANEDSNAATDTTATATGPTSKPVALRLIAFGAAENIHERKDSDDQFIYIRSSQLDAESRPQIAAAPIGWCLRQFVEPRSNVLEYRLDRNILGDRLPFREDGSGNESDDDD